MEKVSQDLKWSNWVNHGDICENLEGGMRNQEFCLSHFQV